jgi:hypothetical protein
MRAAGRSLTQRATCVTLADAVPSEADMDPRAYVSATIVLAHACLVLAGCAASTATTRPLAPTVHVVHSLPADTSGTTFAFQPLEGQTADRDFAAAQDRVRRHLAAHGWHEVDRANARLLVAFDYGVYAVQRSTTSDAAVRDVTGSAAAASSYDSSQKASASSPPTLVDSPAYVSGGFVRVSSVDYERMAHLVIGDRAAAEAGQLQMVYEARARSVSPSPNLSAVLPGLLDAIFAEFPGPSGETRRIDAAAP